MLRLTSSSRLISSSKSFFSTSILCRYPGTAAATATATATKTVKSTTGSGQGGKAEKDQAKAIKAAKALLASVNSPPKKSSAIKKVVKKVAAAAPKKKKVAAKKVIKVKKPKVVKPKKVQLSSSLKPPQSPSNTWQIFLSDFLSQEKANLADGEKLKPIVILTAKAAPIYAALDPSARQDLLDRSNAQKVAYHDVYAAWLSSLTPDMVKEENTIRFRRRRGGLSHKKNLKLDNEPKRPVSSYFQFCNDVRAGNARSGLIEGETKVLEQAKLMANAWRELSESEREAYNQAYLADKTRYVAEKAAFDAERSTATAA